MGVGAPATATLCFLSAAVATFAIFTARSDDFLVSAEPAMSAGDLPAL